MTLAALILLAYVGLTYAFRLYEKGKDPDWSRRFYWISWQGIGGVLVETMCTAVLIVLWIADWVWTLARRWLRMERKARASFRPGDRPVVLCHGYHMRGLTLGVLALRLRRMGRSTVTLPSFGPSTGGIRYYADQLSDHIREVLQETGADAVDLVGHSMGGLVARACAANARRSASDDLRIAHLVTLGTPHRGMGFWVFTWGECGLDMRPGSPFLAWLEEDPSDVDGTAVYSSFDAFVPEDSASGWSAAAVRKVRVDGAGHIALSMLADPARRVFEALKD